MKEEGEERKRRSCQEKGRATMGTGGAKGRKNGRESWRNDCNASTKGYTADYRG